MLRLTPKEYFYTILCCCFIFWGIFSISDKGFAGTSSAHENQPVINLPFLQMGWNGKAALTTWKVNAGFHEGKTDWFSLLASDSLGDLLSRHLSLQGSVHGLPLLEKFEVSEISEINGSAATDLPIISVKRQISPAGLTVEQIFTFTKTPFRFFYTIRIVNPSGNEFVPLPNDRLFLSLGPGLGDQRSKGLGYAESMYSFLEPVVLRNDRFIRHRDDMPHNTELPWAGAETQWLGLHGRYFALLLAPATEKGASALPFDAVHLTYESAGSDFPIAHLPELQMQLPLGKMAPHESFQYEFHVFSGPKSVKALNIEPFACSEILFPGLWQWMRWLCFGLLWVMVKIHSVIPNWGGAIILLAVLVRIIMYPIAKKAMAKQQEFVELQKQMQPELIAIKRNFKGGEQSERILRLYEQHGVSPMAGLKPLLIVLLQLPILIALFHVLGSAYELRDAPFLWINTLSGPDKLFPLGFSVPVLGDYFNLLPVLMAISTVLTMKYSPAPAADAAAKKRQNYFLLIMAVGFLILFYPFPAGMVLYWTVANLLHLAQQGIKSA